MTLRQRFIESKSRALRKTYKPNPRHDKPEYYRRAAEQCWELNADPDDYLAAAFRGCGQKAGPFANTLGGAAHLRWFKEYRSEARESVGLSAELTKEEQERPPEEIVQPCDVELHTDLEMAYSLFWHRNGNTNPLEPRNAAYMRDPYNALQCTALCLLGGHDPAVLKTFGKRIYDFFTGNPQFIVSARKFGFPIDETLKWINDQVLSKS